MVSELIEIQLLLVGAGSRGAASVFGCQLCSGWSESEHKHQELGSESVAERARCRWFPGP